MYSKTRNSTDTRPKKFPLIKKKANIRWNEECKNAVETKKKARNKFKKHPYTETLLLLRSAEALVKKAILRAKKKKLIWKGFASEIDSNIPSSKIHSFTNKMAKSNRKGSKTVPNLSINSINLLTDKNKAEAFAISFKRDRIVSNFTKRSVCKQ